MEVIESINDLIKIIRKDNIIDINKLISIIYKYDIVFNYEKNNEGKIIRLIFRIKNNNNQHSMLYYYSNGCIIDIVKWKILVSPPIAFNKYGSLTKVEEFFNNGLYDIIKIIDGTVVTIYYFNNKWNISSSNCYDVSNYYWIGKLSYSEILYDLFQKLYPHSLELNGIEFNDKILYFNKLCKYKSYTIGFRHHNFHPLCNDPEQIWNIQCVDNNNGNIEYNDGIKGIYNQSIVTDIHSIDKINYINKHSIFEAIKQSDSVYNYGFILRSKDISITKEYSNIIFYSELLKKIKKNIYDGSITLLKQFVNHNNRLNYIMLKNFFNRSERNEIIQLYPQFNENYKIYSKLVNDIINCIIIILKNKQNAINNNEPLNFQKCVIKLSYVLLNNISKYEAFDPYHSDIYNILKDYIINIEYIGLYMITIDKYI
jgi:hypothetical protein